jgi:hypothetical protein
MCLHVKTLGTNINHMTNFYNGGFLHPHVEALLHRAPTLSTSVQPSSKELLYFMLVYGGFYIAHMCLALFYRGPLHYPRVLALLYRGLLCTHLFPALFYRGPLRYPQCPALIYWGPLLYPQVFRPLLKRIFKLPTIVQPSSTEGLYFTHKCSGLFYRASLSYPQLSSPLYGGPLQYFAHMCLVPPYTEGLYFSNFTHNCLVPPYTEVLYFTHKFLAPPPRVRRASTFPTSVQTSSMVYFLKGTASRDFWPLVFSSNIFPWATVSHPKVFSQIISNSRRYSNSKSTQRCQWHRWVKKVSLDSPHFSSFCLKDVG